MKKIKVPHSVIISAEKGPVKVKFPEYAEFHTQIDYNKSQVISGVATVEKELEMIIAHFFFGSHADNNKRKEFEGQILGSDWCSYSAKKKLITYIINENNYLSGKDKSDYESLLKKVMSYRNAFTHGYITITAGENENEALLKYYEGGERSIVLTDDYLSKVEKDIADCFDITQKIKEKSGVITKQEKKEPG